MAQPLFSYGAADWVREPAAAFDAFLSAYRFDGRQLRASSYVIYRGMFQRLLAWLAAERLELLSLDAPMLEAFLDSRPLSAESRHRYLLVFTHLYEHLQRLALAQAGAADGEPGGGQAKEQAEPARRAPRRPARASEPAVEAAPETAPETATPAAEAPLANPAFELLTAKRAPEREAPEAMTEAETDAFFAALEAAPPRGGWKHERNRVMQLTLLATGLRSREILDLKATDLVYAKNGGELREVRVRPHGVNQCRETPIAGFARGALERWVLQRAELAIPGSLLFPADAKGGPLSAATLFRQVKATLERAGIRRRYEGPMLLRNTCAVRWLAHHPPYEVQRWLGHETLRTTETLAELAARATERAEVAKAAKVRPGPAPLRPPAKEKGRSARLRP